MAQIHADNSQSIGNTSLIKLNKIQLIGAGFESQRDIIADFSRSLDQLLSHPVFLIILARATGSSSV
jgi:hypothetical protein